MVSRCIIVPIATRQIAPRAGYGGAITSSSGVCGVRQERGRTGIGRSARSEGPCGDALSCSGVREATPSDSPQRHRGHRETQRRECRWCAACLLRASVPDRKITSSPRSRCTIGRTDAWGRATLWCQFPLGHRDTRRKERKHAGGALSVFSVSLCALCVSVVNLPAVRRPRAVGDWRTAGSFAQDDRGYVRRVAVPAVMPPSITSSAPVM